jgi:ubiquinone/menaquinone biosynthesis C-methylase UbiE
VPPDVAEYYDRYWSSDGYCAVGQLGAFLGKSYASRIPRGARCLDFRCGDGTTTGMWLSEHAGSYIGVDISRTAIEGARQHGLDARLVDDAAQLPFAESDFDAVVA